jgi:hypothetical protein
MLFSAQHPFYYIVSHFQTFTMPSRLPLMSMGECEVCATQPSAVTQSVCQCEGIAFGLRDCTPVALCVSSW